MTKHISVETSFNNINFINTKLHTCYAGILETAMLKSKWLDWKIFHQYFLKTIKWYTFNIKNKCCRQLDEITKKKSEQFFEKEIFDF